MTTTASLSGALHDVIGPHVTDLLTHPWVQAFKRDELSPAAIGFWAAQDQPFCRAEHAAIRRLRSTPGIPADLDAVLADLEADCVREPDEMFAAVLASTGVAPMAAGPACERYCKWLKDQARSGLLAGAAAIFSAEVFYECIFREIGAGYPADGEWRPLIGNWDSPRFTGITAHFAAALDQRAAPSEPVMAVLTPVVAQDAAHERAFMDMCEAAR